MSSILTDEEMIRHYLSGQSNHCLEILYNRYSDKVYRQCLYMTQDSDKAQDFTHDIFIKVFNKLDNFQQRSSFATWIYSIAYNYCTDQMRMAKRIHTTTINRELERRLTECGEAINQEETIQVVMYALSKLTLLEQRLLRLKYEEGLSIEEMAKINELTISAVKMRLKRSRVKIQQFYDRQQAA